jgi:hypothetical protein
VAEVGQILDLGPDAVKHLLHRARLLLCDALRAYLGPSPSC